MSNFDQINERPGSDYRRRRMSRYDGAQPAAPVSETPEAPAVPTGETTRAPKVYDSYRDTEAAARSARSTDDALLEQRSRAFEKQAQHTGVYTRMTQTGYHQTIG